MTIPILATFAEIGGSFAFWVWVRQGKSPLWLIPGIASVMLFAWLLTRTGCRRGGHLCRRGDGNPLRPARVKRQKAMTGLSVHGEFWTRILVLAALGRYVLVPALAPSIWPSLFLMAGALAWTMTSRLLWHRGMVAEDVLLYWGAVLIANLVDALKRPSVTET